MPTDLAFDLRHYLIDVANHYHPGLPGRFHPRDAEHGIYPLWKFGADRVEEILNACGRRTPPPRWLRFELCEMESRAWYEWHWTRGRKLRRDPDYAPRHRRHIADSVRLAVYERDGFACLHCGATESLSLDHIHPYSLGGSDDASNLQTLCRPCNSSKGVKV
jgi:5-methylcytosine-specific restriction endonuclease McrA